MLVELLLVACIALLALIVYLHIRTPLNSNLEQAISAALERRRISETLGELRILAEDIRKNQTSLDRLLGKPTTRGALGEMALESILSDQLPPDMFGIRKKVLDGKYPDAHIKSTVGIICIDSKFPLTNYRKMLESTESEKERWKKEFIKDVEGHLQKVADDYVCPEKGSAQFAFVYIPSESVYWFLVSEAYELLRHYTTIGVQVVSPLTLAHKVELIKAGVHAKKLSEQAQRIQDNIRRLASHFEEVQDLWNTLYGTHLKNMKQKADQLDKAWSFLGEEFERIRKLSD
ncbi:MAG: DNA recombination protein RmuC [Candidatus Thorarchaeota archaeon]